MPGNLQPLDQKFPIVTPDGRPTLYFIQWAQQKQIDISAGITAEQALAIIEQYLADHQLQEGSGISISPSGNLSDAPTIAAEVQAILDQITTTRGSILFRGVDDWQALAPGTAGYFLKTNGVGADPAWVAGGGGGGVPIWGWSSNPTSVSTSANRSKGFIFNVYENMTVDTLMMSVDGQGAGTPVTYTLYLATVNNPTAAGTIQTIIYTGTGQVINQATGATLFISETPGAPINLVPGTNYALFVDASVASPRVRHNSQQNAVIIPLFAIAPRGFLATVAPVVGSAYSVGDVFAGAMRRSA